MCEDICPKVFEMPDEAIVKDGANFEGNEVEIKEAAESCPMEIIKYKE